MPLPRLRPSTPAWLLQESPLFDLDFANGRYYGRALDHLLSISRASSGTAAFGNGTVKLFGSNELRLTDQGLRAEEARTNIVLWNRDLTNAAWTKSNITATLNQTGADGAANSASSLTATAGNGTALQAITLASSARFQSAYVKRLTGSGTVEMTMDNGSTWTALTLTTSYQQLSIPTQTLANPTIGFRIVTSGDAIAVDYVQNENGAFKTSPIPTTTASATRAGEIISTIGALKTAVNGASGSLLVVTSGMETTGNRRIVGPTTNDYRLYTNAGQALTTHNNVTGLNTANTGSGSWANTNRSGVSWSAAGRSLVLNGGTVATDSVVPPLTETLYLGSTSAGSEPINGLITRLTVWGSRHSDAMLKVLTS